MIAMEGADRTGKSEISKELASRLGYAYFKNSGEWTAELWSTEYFKNVLTYGATLQTDMLCQVRPNLVLDRYYPSEWVYSKVFKRESDEKILTRLDEKFAEAGGRIVICRRKSFDGINDDLHAYVDTEVLKELDKKYEEFAAWTKCKVMTLWVDDENLDREISEITTWLLSE